MNAPLRKAFNAAFTDERYAAMVEWLNREAGLEIPFRICETPLFLTPALARELATAAESIRTAIAAPSYREASIRAVPPSWSVPGEDTHPVFLQVDFALVQRPGGEPGDLMPQLIELQGFPSLYGFQSLLNRAYHRHFHLAPELSPYFSGLDEATYGEALRAVLVGDEDPETVVLLEIEPEKQKTRVDFAVTEQMTGVRAVDASAVTVRGDRAFYQRAGREVPIRRIYNRVIFDEAERRGLDFGPLFRAPLDVTWVGHPNWFWRVSKFSLPFLSGPHCPQSHFLSDLDGLPPDLENYVLKPLFSFAGRGVTIGTDAETLRAIPDPENYILQRRVEYAPAIETPDGPAKAEVRMMYFWTDRPRLVNNLVRTTKGKMVGVDFNKDRTWIGASVALH
jgi:hypothetical protein